MLLRTRRRPSVTGPAVWPPASAPPSSSQISASPAPLCSPNGSSAPVGSTTVKRGSVVGSPWLSMIVPGSTGRPLL